jgi:hypothetical protein
MLEIIMHNPVAKNAYKFNKSVVMADRKQYKRKPKHKTDLDYDNNKRGKK